MADQRQLEGRVALITGGGRGIGRAIALAYAAEGAKLALAARTESELRDTAEAITTRHGTDVHTVIADVSSRQQVDNAVASALERFGAIDVLVNNAGNLGPVGVLWENDPDEWEQTIAIHVLGTFYGCRAVIPHMLERAPAASSTCPAWAAPTSPPTRSPRWASPTSPKTWPWSWPTRPSR